MVLAVLELFGGGDCGFGWNCGLLWCLGVSVVLWWCFGLRFDCAGWRFMAILVVPGFWI